MAAIATRWMMMFTAAPRWRSSTPAAERTASEMFSRLSASAINSSAALLPSCSIGHTARTATPTRAISSRRVTEDVRYWEVLRGSLPPSWMRAMSNPNIPKDATIIPRPIAQENSPKPSGPRILVATANMPNDASLPTISATAKSTAVRDR